MNKNWKRNSSILLILQLRGKKAYFFSGIWSYFAYRISHSGIWSYFAYRISHSRLLAFLGPSNNNVIPEVWVGYKDFRSTEIWYKGGGRWFGLNITALQKDIKVRTDNIKSRGSQNFIPFFQVLAKP